MQIENGTINYTVYEGANEFLGMAEVSLPEFSTMAEEIKGAGIAGALSGPYIGHLEPMTLGLNFRSVTKSATVMPLKYAPGKVAPASPADSSGEYSISYYALFINGERSIEVDIINFIFFVNGVDYLEDVRKALGK